MSAVLCLLLGVFPVPLPFQAKTSTRSTRKSRFRNTVARRHEGTRRPLRLQKDAKELAGLCASVSDDMDHVKQGLLSKAAPEKLKRMEKLAKRVREELTQTSTAP